MSVLAENPHGEHYGTGREKKTEGRQSLLRRERWKKKGTKGKSGGQTATESLPNVAGREKTKNDGEKKWGRVPEEKGKSIYEKGDTAVPFRDIFHRKTKQGVNGRRQEKKVPKEGKGGCP